MKYDSHPFLWLIMIGVVITGLALLSGCQTGRTSTIVTSNKLVVVQPPDNLYDCPVIKKWPSADTLTDSQVARLLVELERYNKRCANSVAAVKAYLAKAGKTVR